MYVCFPYLFCWYELSQVLSQSVKEENDGENTETKCLYSTQTYRISTYFYYSFSFDFILTFRLHLIPKIM